MFDHESAKAIHSTLLNVKKIFFWRDKTTGSHLSHQVIYNVFY